MELGTGFWMLSGGFMVIFLGAVAVEQWMMARKYRRTQKTEGELEKETPQADAPE